MVPETLLKKRKSQEKAREANSAEREKKKAVRILLILYMQEEHDYLMIQPILRLDYKSMLSLC